MTEVRSNLVEALLHFPQGGKGEHVIRLRLTHELAEKVGADFRIRILQPLAKNVERQVLVPKKVGAASVIREAIHRRGSESRHGQCESNGPDFDR